MNIFRNILTSAAHAAKDRCRIQYVSDLHLEWNKVDYQKLVKPVAPFLALAGDICPPSHPALAPFLEHVSNNFEHVFYVPGNHEYDNLTGITMEDQNDSLVKACAAHPNIHFLNRQSYKLTDLNVAIVGATLWSPTFTSQSLKNAEALNYKDRVFLTNMCDYYARTGTQVVMLSHFLPSSELILEKYKNYPNKHRFYSNCDDLIGTPVRAWIYGHSHSASRHIINDVQCVLNPYGYGKENADGKNGYSNKIFVEFDLPSNAMEDMGQFSQCTFH